MITCLFQTKSRQLKLKCPLLNIFFLQLHTIKHFLSVGHCSLLCLIVVHCGLLWSIVAYFGLLGFTVVYVAYYGSLWHIVALCASFQLNAVYFSSVFPIVAHSVHVFYCAQQFLNVVHCGQLQHTAGHCESLWLIVNCGSLQLNFALYWSFCHFRLLSLIDVHCGLLQLIVTLCGLLQFALVY